MLFFIFHVPEDFTHKQQRPPSEDKWRAVTALTFLLEQTKEWRCTHNVTWMIITSGLWA